jgi:anthranilate phosphoribosyltransferase
VAFNAGAARRLLDGQPGPVRDAVLVNSAVALATQGGLGGDLLTALRDGMSRAAESIDSGAAGRGLEHGIEVARAAQAAE